jgi:sec-independent protein translocase protein TatA
MPLGPPELILILLIVVVVFGVGKLTQVGPALGKSIRGFRDAVEGDPEKPATTTTTPATPPAEDKKTIV